MSSLTEKLSSGLSSSYGAMSSKERSAMTCILGGCSPSMVPGVAQGVPMGPPL